MHASNATTSWFKNSDYSPNQKRHFLHSEVNNSAWQISVKKLILGKIKFNSKNAFGTFSYWSKAAVIPLETMREGIIWPLLLKDRANYAEQKLI